MQEVELKFLEIDIEETKQKLLELGAVLVYDTTIHSQSFNGNGFHGSDSSQKYLRIRETDGKVTLTYKEPAVQDSLTTSRKEIEIELDNYEKGLELVSSLGLVPEEVFSKHRSHFELGTLHFEIDTVSGIPPYLEIETENEEEMSRACELLGLSITNGKKGTIFEIYKELSW